MKTSRMREQPIKVMVADGTRIHTELLVNALRCNRALEVFCPAPESTDLAGRAVHHKVDVVVIASRLAEEPLGGVEVLRKIRTLRPQVRGVILLDCSKPEIILGAFRAGARGLFTRDAPLEALSECVLRVHAGEVWANVEHMAIALDALTASPVLRNADSNGLSLLSKRELDVVFSLAEGLSNREIAARLGLSQHTVKNYLFRVFDKLGVSSRIELLFLTLNHSMAKNSVPSEGSDAENGSSFAAVQSSADQGKPRAQMALAKMYGEGKGVAKDPRAAYAWYLICEKTMLEMKDAIGGEKRRMAGLLTTEEILEAQKLASEHGKKPVQSTAQIPAGQHANASS
ncbi:MAG: LuxR C-terminal-related transcriptional regulator [Terriglobales bacterium]